MANVNVFAQLKDSLPPLLPAQDPTLPTSVFAPTADSAPAQLALVGKAPAPSKVFAPISPEETHAAMENVRRPQAGAPPVFASLSDMNGGPPQLPAPNRPNVFRTPTPVEKDRDANEAKLEGMRAQDAKPHHGWGEVGHVFAKIGNTVGDILAPSTMALTPGTELNRRLTEAGLSRTVNDETAQIAENKEHEAQAANLDAQPELKAQEAQLTKDKQDEKAQHDQQMIDASLRRSGYKLGPDGKPVPLTRDEMSQKEIAADDYKTAQTAYEQAVADFKHAQQANLPAQMELARQRALTAMQNAQTAAERLGISRELLNFHEDEFYNPQPTGTERSRGDLAQSALNQIATLRQIIAAHPEMAGPGGSARQSFQRWFSSDAEDAGKFKAAATYLAEHGAGALGARGAYIVHELQSLTNPNFDPSALTGALDQAQETFQHFANVGTTHGRGGRSTAQGVQGPPSGMVQVQIPGQRPGYIPSSALKQFKKDHPNAQEVH